MGDITPIRRHTDAAGVLSVGLITGSSIGGEPRAMLGVPVILIALVAVVVLARRGWMPLPVAFGLATVFLLGPLAAELTDNVEDHNGITTADPGSLDWVIAHRHSRLTPIAMIISDAGGTLPMATLAPVTCLWLAWQRCWTQAALVAVATAGAAGLVVTLKALVGRTRPPVIDHLVVETNQSYPSGHSLDAMGRPQRDSWRVRRQAGCRGQNGGAGG